MDVVYFQVKSSLCTDAPSPEKNWGGDRRGGPPQANSTGASSSNVENYKSSNIISKKLVHLILLLKDDSFRHSRTPKN